MKIEAIENMSEPGDSKDLRPLLCRGLAALILISAASLRTSMVSADSGDVASQIGAVAAVENYAKAISSLMP